MDLLTRFMGTRTKRGSFYFMFLYNGLLLNDPTQTAGSNCCHRDVPYFFVSRAIRAELGVRAGVADLDFRVVSEDGRAMTRSRYVAGSG